MKEDVEQMLPRKKEMIIYANMTEIQKRIDDYLVKKTFDVYLNEESDSVLRRPGIMEYYLDSKGLEVRFAELMVLLSWKRGGDRTLRWICRPWIDATGLVVHVYRLAHSHSVDGRIIKKAFGKLKLEHVVLALLRDEQDEEDRMIQTDISDEDLLKVMDRSDMSGPPGARGGFRTGAGGAAAPVQAKKHRACAYMKCLGPNECLLSVLLAAGPSFSLY